MQFICTNCDGAYEISARAFGERQDTRTRCPRCRTWLILTRNPGDQVLATLDPTAPAPAAPNGAPMPGPTRRIAPSRSPSAPTAVSQTVTRPSPAAAPAGDSADIFFAPRLRPGSGAERLGTVAADEAEEARYDPVGIGTPIVEAEGVIQAVVRDRPAHRQARFDLAASIATDQTLRHSSQKRRIDVAGQAVDRIAKPRLTSDHTHRHFVLATATTAAGHQYCRHERDQRGTIHFSFRVLLG